MTSSNETLNKFSKVEQKLKLNRALACQTLLKSFSVSHCSVKGQERDVGFSDRQRGERRIQTSRRLEEKSLTQCTTVHTQSDRES